MIPYLEQPRLEIGPFTIYAFGVLAAFAILVGWVLTSRRAERRGLSRATAHHMYELMVLVGFLGAWLARILVYAPGTWTGISSFGGIFGGFAAGILYLRWYKGLDAARMWSYIDALAFSFPLPWMIARAGCFMAHDHPGIPANGWLAINFPSGPRYDLGLIEMLYMIPVGLLFLFLDRRRRRSGFYAGLLLTLIGPFRIWLDHLHVTRPTILGLGADQWGGAIALVAGCVILVARVLLQDKTVDPSA